MTTMATRSSAMARVEKNTLAPTGMRLPKRLMTARAKAMSVAVGMAQPCMASPPRLMPM